MNKRQLDWHVQSYLRNKKDRAIILDNPPMATETDPVYLDWLQWTTSALESHIPEGPTGGETSKLWVDYDETFDLIPTKLVGSFPGKTLYYDYKMDWNTRGTVKSLDFNWMKEQTFSLCNGKGISGIGLPGTNLADQAAHQIKLSGSNDFIGELNTIKNKLLHANVELLHIRTAKLWPDLVNWIKNLLKNGNKITLEILGEPLAYKNDQPQFAKSRKKIFNLSIPFNMLTHKYGSKTKFEFNPDVSEETKEMWFNMITEFRKRYNNAAWAAANDLMQSVEDQLWTVETPQPVLFDTTPKQWIKGQTQHAPVSSQPTEVTDEMRLYVHKYGSAYGYDIRCFDLEPTNAAPSNKLSGKPGYAGTTFRSFWMDSEPYGGGLSDDTDARRLAKAYETSRRKDNFTHRADHDYIIAEAYQAIKWLRSNSLLLEPTKHSECACGEILNNTRDEYCPVCNNYNLYYQV